MTTVVRFLVGEGIYAIPVDNVREVRSGERLLPIPSPRDGVIGLVREGADAFAVLEALGSGGEHILLLQHHTRTFGLSVGAVTAVTDVAGDIGPAPDGQAGHLISGVVETEDGLVLLVDVTALVDLLDAAGPAVVRPDTRTTASVDASEVGVLA